MTTHSTHLDSVRATYVRAGSKATRSRHQEFLTQVDDFEDGNIDEYEGDTGSFTVQSTTVLEGNQSLEGTTGNLGGSNEIVSTTGLPVYPSSGQTFRFNVRLNETDDQPEVSFAVQTQSLTADRYYVLLDAANDQLELRKVETTDQGIESGSAALSSNLNDALEIEVQWGIGGSIPVTLSDSGGAEIASLPGNTTDTSFSTGGISWVANTADAASRTMQFDDMRLV